ncbi:uncharacterized protein LOC128244645 isoform X2 [Mya arenaria]|uniref:uncharacterized protein LOC128244645 isoform X2 n=1 Tax=Mya arenaria TaxID=6604 RepID=UPI0022DEEBBA|nr:uncharacterized protein LOC128244645 isoform X2 [Mya arenaria]
MCMDIWRSQGTDFKNVRLQVTIRRVVLLFLVCLSVYIYLYINTFDGMKSSAVYGLQNSIPSLGEEQSQTHLQDLKSLKMEFFARREIEQEQTTPLPTITDVVKIHSNFDKEQLQKYRTRILKKESVPLLTLFTTWNYNLEKDLVHNITVFNWMSLNPFVIPVVFTNDSDVAADCSRKGWKVLPVLITAAEGVPVLKYMYRDVMEKYNTTLYAYSNADILFADTLPDSLVHIITNTSLDLTQPALMVGKRTNVKNVTSEEGSAWYNITKIAKDRGTLFNGWAEDYFITTRSFPWHDMPEVVIGRRAYDNWLVFHSREMKYSVIDITRRVLAVHQTTKAGNREGHSHKNKDYNHNLVVKMYKIIRYHLGVIECIEKYTQYEYGIVRIKNRNNRKGCKAG